MTLPADSTLAAERLQFVLELGQQVTSILDIDALLPEACRRIAAAFTYDTVGIHLLDPLDQERLFQAAVHPLERALPRSFRVPLGRGLTGWVARHGQPRLANDISNEAHYIPGPGRATRSELDVPLRVGERTIGVLNVESERLSAFASDDVPYLQGVAVLLAQAIENARLASRSRQLAAAEERSRLARDLHDDTVQALVAIDRQLDLLELDLADAEQTRRRIGAVQALVQRTMDGVRRLSRNLHPAVLEDLGLVPALQAHIQDLEASGLGVTITRKGRARRLPPAIEYAAYRVAQEALSNVLRHAGAPEADLQISFSPDDLELVVSDQGQGTGDMPPSLSRGQGIASMRDRAAEVGGVLEFESAPGKGTRVRLRVPLRLTMVARL